MLLAGINTTKPQTAKLNQYVSVENAVLVPMLGIGAQAIVGEGLGRATRQGVAGTLALKAWCCHG